MKITISRGLAPLSMPSFAPALKRFALVLTFLCASFLSFAQQGPDNIIYNPNNPGSGELFSMTGEYSLDFYDGTCWVECALRDKKDNSLLVMTGWQLTLVGSVRLQPIQVQL